MHFGRFKWYFGRTKWYFGRIKWHEAENCCKLGLKFQITFGHGAFKLLLPHSLHFFVDGVFSEVKLGCLLSFIMIMFYYVLFIIGDD